VIVAVYARKSTEQDRDASVERQVQICRALATAQGWHVDERYVVADKAVSGAEFAKRPGLQALLAALALRPVPFQRVLVTDKDRLGREQIETAYLLKQFARAGVRVVEATTGQPIALATPIDKVLLSVTGFAAEMERDQARHRTHQALLLKARQRHVTGGRVFGYGNHDVYPADADPTTRPKRLYVERRILEPEAAVVRRIFELSANGLGLRAIAHRLNDEGAPAPLPRRPGRPRGWAPSSVREVLHRDLYRGVIVWNQTRRRDEWGLKKPTPRDPSEWVREVDERLRIVAQPLWQAVHERLHRTRQAYLRDTEGQVWGRPPSSVESKYLLTGMAACGWCGATLHVRSRSHGRRRAFFYGCTAHHHRGASICRNSLELPMLETDEALLATFEAQLLHPEVVQQAIREAVAQLAAASAPPPARLETIRAEVARVTAQLGHLTNAVVLGGDLPTLVAEMKTLERRRAGLHAETQRLEQGDGFRAADLLAVESELLMRLADWRALFRRHLREARQMLGQLLVGRVIFTPRATGPDWEVDYAAEGSLGGLVAGVLGPKAVVAPTGFEPVYAVRHALS
jgi:DNA invertase Pin-like site-specific DNA recombinase